MLKTLGFVRRQVSAAVAWQATTVALVALAAGLPLGVALGRWTWTLLIDRIGLGAEPVTPWPALLAATLATVLAANLVAAWPGRMAARTLPAVALRSECSGGDGRAVDAGQGEAKGRVGANPFLALLVGLAGALVLAAAAGARRSEAALPRFLAANQDGGRRRLRSGLEPVRRPVRARRRVDALPEVRQVFRATGWTTGALILAVADPTDPSRWHRRSARPPWTRGAAWCWAVRSWSPAACPTSAGRPSTRSWPSVATSA